MGEPRVAAVHDLSGLGRCSLTTALPVLSAMGVEACPLPTAVYSNQTGFGEYASVDLTDFMEQSLDCWERLDVRFDGVYTGFLSNIRQVELIKRLIAERLKENAVIVVDPVLGDDGSLYPVYNAAMCAAIQELVRHAQVITPNLTEACLLVGGDYGSLCHSQADAPIYALAEKLHKLGPDTVVITGVPRGDSLANYLSLRNGQKAVVSGRRLGTGYSGTGDILAAVLTGELVLGGSAQTALEKAVALLGSAIEEAWREGSAPNEGIPFEKNLMLLRGITSDERG